MIFYCVQSYSSDEAELDGGADDVWCTSLAAARSAARVLVPKKDPSIEIGDDGKEHGGGIFEAKIDRVDVNPGNGRAGVCRLLNQKAFVRSRERIETWSLRFGGKRTLYKGDEEPPTGLKLGEG